jgi:hypothetical protein
MGGIMYEHDVAYVCDGCGEAFAPTDDADWKELRRIHRVECGATFTKTTVGKAF